MKWLPWRRKDAAMDVARSADRSGRFARSTARSHAASDDVLGFVRAYLTATGARVRLEGDDTLSATLPDGATVRYTTAPAHADATTHLLAPGDAELARMLDDANLRARITWLRLVPADETAALVRELVAASGHTVRSLTVIRQWEAHAAELTYRISARDRGGRTIEWLRVARDMLTGRPVEPLTLDQIARSKHTEPAADTLAAASHIVSRADDLVQPQLDAAGIFLRQRAAEAYRARRADVRATHDRLLREQPDAARQFALGLERELAALSEVHAVEVRGTLESICLIATPMAEVRVRTKDGTELSLTLDLGRGRGITPAEHAENRAQSEPAATPPRNGRRLSEALTVAHLAALTPALWRECARWLLACSGYVVEADGDPTNGAEGVLILRGQLGERQFVALALRLPDERPVGAGDVRRAAAIPAGQPSGTHALLLSPSPADDQARRTASELQVDLWDHDRLAAELARIAGEHRIEEARVTRDAKERVAAAAKTRASLLDALRQASGPLDGNVAHGAHPSPAHAAPAVGHAALREAVAELGSIQTSAEQAFLAWETLVGDWLAAFAERPTRAGALEIVADTAHFRELRERGAHLAKATRQTFERLARTPADGEMGYGAWRAALIEAHRARLAALGAQFERVDPQHWEDADRARTAEADARADQTRRAAKAAEARAAKAHSQIAHLAARV